MARIYKKNGKWAFSFELGKDMYGKRKRVSRTGFLTKKEAQQAASKFEINSLNKYNKDNISIITFHDFMFNDWYNHHSKYVKPSTAYNLLTHLKRIDKFFGDKLPISKINEEECVAFKQYLKYKTKLAHASCLFTFSYFKQILRYATFNKNILKEDPSRKVVFKEDIQDKFKTVLDRHNKSHPIIEQKELHLILKKLNEVSKKNLKTYTKVMFTKLLIYTGLRFNEAASLTWDDIDINRRIIKVQKNYIIINARNIVVQTPKTKSSIRNVTISKDFFNKLLELRQLILNLYKEHPRKDYTFGELVFPSLSNQRSGYKMLNITYNKWIKTFLKDFSYLHIHPHMFRHTHASLLIQEGANLIDVSKRLGHSSVSVTESIYVHLTRVQDEKLAETIENTLK